MRCPAGLADAQQERRLAGRRPLLEAALPAGTLPATFGAVQYQQRQCRHQEGSRPHRQTVRKDWCLFWLPALFDTLVPTNLLKNRSKTLWRDTRGPLEKLVRGLLFFFRACRVTELIYASPDVTIGLERRCRHSQDVMLPGWKDVVSVWLQQVRSWRGLIPVCRLANPFY